MTENELKEYLTFHKLSGKKAVLRHKTMRRAILIHEIDGERVTYAKIYSRATRIMSMKNLCHRYKIPQ